MARPARGSRETSIRPWHPDANGQRFSLYDEAARITQDSAKSAPGFWHYRYVDYDQSGNVTLTRVYEADPDGNQVWDAQASYYDAAEQLRLVNRAIGPYANDETHPGQRNVYEEYRYDALGRRVLRRSRRTSSCTASSAECASSIERTVWDGDQVAFEIRAKGGTSEVPGTLEMDHLTYTGTDGLGLGQVAYVHAGALDQPVTVYRMGFNGSSTPIKVHPHPNWRGLYEFGTTNTGAVQSSPAIAWPGGQATVDGQVWAPTDGPAWFGNLISGKADGSGLQYMRNRYYDPATGRFTQEDPIGLAGGANVYGFAGGDPVNYGDPFGLCADPGPGSYNNTGKKCVTKLILGADARFIRSILDQYVRKSPGCKAVANRVLGILQGGRMSSYREHSYVDPKDHSRTEFADYHSDKDEIHMSETSLAQPPRGVARTLIHEGFHAMSGFADDPQHQGTDNLSNQMAESCTR